MVSYTGCIAFILGAAAVPSNGKWTSGDGGKHNVAVAQEMVEVKVVAKVGIGYAAHVVLDDSVLDHYQLSKSPKEGGEIDGKTVENGQLCGLGPHPACFDLKFIKLMVGMSVKLMVPKNKLLFIDVEAGARKYVDITKPGTVNCWGTSLHPKCKLE